MTNEQPRERVGDSYRFVEGKSAWRLVAQHRYDHDATGGLTAAIVSALADRRTGSAEGEDSPPLYEVVDSAALEAVFFPEEKNERRPIGAAIFHYAECLVEVRSDGWIHVYESTDTECTDDQ